MKMMLIAALLITLPALVALIYGIVWGPHWIIYAALASVSINALPFLAAGFMFRGRSNDEMGGHH